MDESKVYTYFRTVNIFRARSVYHVIFYPIKDYTWPLCMVNLVMQIRMDISRKFKIT